LNGWNGPQKTAQPSKVYTSITKSTKSHHHPTQPHNHLNHLHPAFPPLPFFPGSHRAHDDCRKSVKSIRPYVWLSSSPKFLNLKIPVPPVNIIGKYWRHRSCGIARGPCPSSTEPMQSLFVCQFFPLFFPSSILFSLYFFPPLPSFHLHPPIFLRVLAAKNKCSRKNHSTDVVFHQPTTTKRTAWVETTRLNFSEQPRTRTRHGRQGSREPTIVGLKGSAWLNVSSFFFFCFFLLRERHTRNIIHFFFGGRASRPPLTVGCGSVNSRSASVLVPYYFAN